jgi:hypothetical protein
MSANCYIIWSKAVNNSVMLQYRSCSINIEHSLSLFNEATFMSASIGWVGGEREDLAAPDLIDGL